ncbi:PLP-dependent transferase [Streptomyces rapamycinicus]|uniref:PLP-dependent transferase n=1 Tax=Streptomyces rhizosphaericus TaxID=114699 RepID=A0A6G4A952_9ACTN|nr:PLP-dependent transferase [Streptomyces rhizosphaericus]NEW69229.1 PLP-dependent transferase [Streptomyces rhizosphaericus]
MNQDDRGLATRLLHGRGANPLGAVAAPIFDTASFAMADMAAHRRTVEDPSVHDYYSRVRYPTVAALESTLASIESAPRALAFASGMAAITTALLALGRRGGTSSRRTSCSSTAGSGWRMTFRTSGAR